MMDPLDPQSPHGRQLIADLDVLLAELAMNVAAREAAAELAAEDAA